MSEKPDEKTILMLEKKALEARKRAYTPYSHFSVGAALLCTNGHVYLGCNIENASYTPVNCAERTAFFKAVSEGERDFEAMAIAGGPDSGEDLVLCSPCGVCRQVMREFCRDDFLIFFSDGKGGFISRTLSEMLPFGFGPDQLLGHGEN